MKPGGSTFNIQNFIPHKSQKTKAVPETNRAKEFQRGTAGVPESTKEGARGLSEGSDIGLGPGCREFESRHSDHKSRKSICSLGFYLLNGARLEQSNATVRWIAACHRSRRRQHIYPCPSGSEVSADVSGTLNFTSCVSTILHGTAKAEMTVTGGGDKSTGEMLAGVAGRVISPTPGCVCMRRRCSP